MSFNVEYSSFKNAHGLKGKSNKVYILLLVILFVLFSFRVIGLDRDFPNFGLTYYQAKDEGTYSTMAILLYNYGNVSYADDMEIVIAPTFRANIVGNLLQFLSMTVLGDNYYGFRIPYVLITFGTFVFTFLTLKEIIKIYKFPQICKWGILPILFYMIFDFSFLMSSRCVENSSIRAFVTILCIYLWLKYHCNNKKKYFWLGFFSITAMFFVYYSNVHLLGVSCVIGGIKFIQLIVKQDNNFKEYCINWLKGFVFGHILVELYYFTMWKSGCWTTLFSSLSSFADRIVTSSQSNQSVLLTYLKGFLTFWSSNMFFYGFIILLLIIITVCINIIIYFKTKDENLLIVLGVLFVMILQSTFTNDWMERKAISIYPILFVNIFLAVTLFKWGKYKLSQKVLNAILVLPILGCLPLLYVMVRFRVSKSYFVDFEQIDINIWGVLTLIQILFIFIFIIFKFLNKNKICMNALMISFSFAILVNCYFSTKYVYLYKEYSEKEAMIGIGEIVGEEYVAGPYTYAYTLYNDIKPVWNAENYCLEYIEDGKIRYFCDYSSGPYYVGLMNAEGDFSLVQSFERKLIAQGKEFPIGLYEKVIQ